MFTDNFDFYLKVIEAYKKFVAEVKSENIFAIINVGKVCFNEFKNGNNHNIPSSIKLVPFAPQLEILKRASIFLTHCGMNSTSESIWFGVPMICMPVSVDQPLVANFVTGELGLGILLDVNDFKFEELANVFQKMFSEDSFQKKSFEYSQISQKYNGIERATELIRGAFKQSS
jgi:UDP:flavonoid glycosyltransferase YjiC (YdhE family)